MAIKLKKEPTEAVQYKVKTDLPGGISKDDIIDWDPKLKKYFHVKTKKEFPWDCNTETKFFTVIKPAQYKAGEFIYVIKNGTYKSAVNTSTNVYVHSDEDLKIISVNDDLLYLVENPQGMRFYVAEDKVKPISIWMFYNSDGVLQKLTSRKHPNKQIFCKSIGNYFTSTEQAVEWLNEVKAKFGA
jgi:hypothetical protein